METYFAGGENSAQLQRLIDHKVERIAVGFFGWQQAHANDDLRRVFPQDIKLVLHAGASRQKNLDWGEFALNYLDFAEHNVERVEWVYELDSAHCPEDTRLSLRRAMDTMDKIVMVPHRNEPGQLALTASQYERVLVNATLSNRLEFRDLRRVRATLFGSNILNAQKLAAGRFVVTTTMAWLSPRRYGEMLLFTRSGHLKHFPATERAREVEIHRRDITDFGIDPAACANGDMAALTTLAVKSIIEMEARFNERRRDRKAATASSEEPEPTPTPAPVDTPAPVMYKQMVNQLRVPLPSITPARQPGRTFSANQRSLRQCDTCSLAEVCPKFDPHSDCAFDIPVEIATREDWISACQVILDFQFQRVTFGHFSEQLEGGQITERVGKEMDRFMRLMKEVQALQHTQEQAEGGIFTQRLLQITGQIEDVGDGETPEGQGTSEPTEEHQSHGQEEGPSGPPEDESGGHEEGSRQTHDQTHDGQGARQEDGAPHQAGQSQAPGTG